MTDLTLGQFLRQERENRGITIEQVASATKISVRLLHVLEGDQFADLPAAPFIRGFVTSYCRFVGLDERDILTRFKTFIEDKSRERPAKDSGHSGYAFERKGADRSRATLWMVMSGMVVLGGVMIVLLKPALKHRRISHIEQLRAAQGDAKVAQQPASGPATADGAVPMAGTAPASTTPSKPGATQAAVPPATPMTKPVSPVKPAPTSSEEEEEEDVPAVAEEDAQAEPEATLTKMTAAAPTRPTETHPKTPAPIATPAKPAAPAPVAATSTTAALQAAAAENPKDPLNKGDELKWTEVKQKVIFRSLENIWVRYSVDDKKMTQFMLLKGKQLVLKGREAVRFQVSNPKAVEFSYAGGAYRLLSAAKTLSTHNETATLVVPPQVLETTPEPFPGLPPLAKTPDPTPSAASGSANTDG